MSGEHGGGQGAEPSFPCPSHDLPKVPVESLRGGGDLEGQDGGSQGTPRAPSATCALTCLEPAVTVGQGARSRAEEPHLPLDPAWKLRLHLLTHCQSTCVCRQCRVCSEHSSSHRLTTQTVRPPRDSQRPREPQTRLWGCHSLLQGIFPTGIESRSPALQADSLASEPSGKPKNIGGGCLSLL